MHCQMDIGPLRAVLVSCQNLLYYIAVPQCDFSAKKNPLKLKVQDFIHSDVALWSENFV